MVPKLYRNCTDAVPAREQGIVLGASFFSYVVGSFCSVLAKLGEREASFQARENPRLTPSRSPKTLFDPSRLAKNPCFSRLGSPKFLLDPPPPYRLAKRPA